MDALALALMFSRERGKGSHEREMTMMGTWQASQKHATKDAAVAEYLAPRIERAEVHVRDRAREAKDDLVLLQQALRTQSGRAFRQLDMEAVNEWLRNVSYAANHRRRVIRRLATADAGAQHVTFNPHYVHEIVNEQVLDGEWTESELMLRDTILHELAHLFAFRFFGADGHGRIWRKVADEFGAAPWGCTRRKKRMRWIRANQPKSRAEEVG